MISNWKNPLVSIIIFIQKYSIIAKVMVRKTWVTEVGHSVGMNSHLKRKSVQCRGVGRVKISNIHVIISPLKAFLAPIYGLNVRQIAINHVSQSANRFRLNDHQWVTNWPIPAIIYRPERHPFEVGRLHRWHNIIEIKTLYTNVRSVIGYWLSITMTSNIHTSYPSCQSVQCVTNLSGTSDTLMARGCLVILLICYKVLDAKKKKKHFCTWMMYNDP